MMSRWSSTQANSGFCVTCSQYSTTTTFKSPCQCKQLSENECNSAFPQCSYDGLNCVMTNCNMITSQNECAVNSNCIYLGQCLNYDLPYQCTNIINATSAIDCYTASVNCPQFIPNSPGYPGTCGVAQQCSELGSISACDDYNSQVAADYCVWNNNQCQTIHNCTQITDIVLCSLQTNRCQWNVVLNSCITQSCNSYTSQQDCTYVYTSYSPGDVALCYWDSLYNDCQSASFSITETYNQADSSQCFIQTGHVYHMDGKKCKRCFEKILSILLITVLFISI